MTNDLRLRPAVRAVVMTPDRRILLVHFDFETAELPNGLWACPGGGVDPGETPVDALRRELREEVGLVVGVEEVGDPIWFKEHEFDIAGWDGQADTFYLIEVDVFEPAPQFSRAEMLAEHVDDLRWWTWAELAETTQDDLTVMSPRHLFPLLEELMTQGRPLEPRRIDPH